MRSSPYQFRWRTCATNAVSRLWGAGERIGGSFASRICPPPAIFASRSSSTTQGGKRPSTRYARLIAAFARLTGVPLLLNTSFNENEPIVLRPEEALDCFLRTRMDALVMGRHSIERRPDA